MNPKVFYPAGYEPSRVFTALTRESMVVPIYSNETKERFVSEDIIRPWPVTIGTDGLEFGFNTSAIKIGTPFDMIGISMNESLIKAGIVSQTDSLDVSIQLRGLFAKFGSDVIYIPAENDVHSHFVFDPASGDHRRLVSKFNSFTNIWNGDKSIYGDVFDKKYADTFEGLKCYVVAATVSGEVNIETGNSILKQEYGYIDHEGNACHVDEVEILGWTFKAERMNRNISKRGIARPVEDDPKGAARTFITTHLIDGEDSKLKIELGDKDPNGVTVGYLVHGIDKYANPHATPYEGRTQIVFQNGQVKDGVWNGLTNEVLLAILENRLEELQKTVHACAENANALEHIKEANRHLKQRVVRLRLPIQTISAPQADVVCDYFNDWTKPNK